MATASDVPSLDVLLDSILDQLPRDAVASIAAMRPEAARRRETFADLGICVVARKRKDDNCKADTPRAEPPLIP